MEVTLTRARQFVRSVCAGAAMQLRKLRDCRLLRGVAETGYLSGKPSGNQVRLPHAQSESRANPGGNDDLQVYEDDARYV